MGQAESHPATSSGGGGEMVAAADPVAPPVASPRKEQAQAPFWMRRSVAGSAAETAETPAGSSPNARASISSRRSPLAWAAAGVELVAATTAEVAVSTMSAALKTASVLASTTEAAANVVAHTTTNVAINTANVATQTASLITTATSAGAKTAGDAIAGTASMVVENLSGPVSASPKHPTARDNRTRTRSRSGESSGHISPVSRAAFFATTNQRSTSDKLLPEAISLGAITQSSSHDNLQEIEQRAPMRNVGTRFWCMVGATNTSARRHWVATVTNSKPTAPAAKYLRKILALAWETKGQSVEEFYRLVQLRPLTTSPNCALKTLITALRIVREGPPEALKLSTMHVSLIDAVGAAWAERVLLDVATDPHTPSKEGSATPQVPFIIKDELMDQMLIARLSGLLVQKMHFHASRGVLNARYEIVEGSDGPSNLSADEEWERQVQQASALLTLLGTIEAVARLALGMGGDTTSSNSQRNSPTSETSAVTPSVASLSLAAVLIEEALSAFDALSQALVDTLNIVQQDPEASNLVRSLMTRYQEAYQSLRAYCQAALQFPYIVALNKVPNLEAELAPLSHGVTPLTKSSQFGSSPGHTLYPSSSSSSGSMTTANSTAGAKPFSIKAPANLPPSLAARPFTRRSILETLEEEELLENRLNKPSSDSDTDAVTNEDAHEQPNDSNGSPLRRLDDTETEEEEEEESKEDGLLSADVSNNPLWIGSAMLSNSIEHARPPSFFCLETEDEDYQALSGVDEDNPLPMSEDAAQVKPVRTRTHGNPFDTGNSSILLLAEAHRSAFSTISNPFASGHISAFTTNQPKNSQQPHMKEVSVMTTTQKKAATKRALEQCERLFEFSGINLRPEDIAIGKDLIGRGAFSLVHRGTLRSTGQEVAVKELIIEDLNQSPETILDFRAEVAVMKAVHHPNVLQLIGASTRPNLRLISEFCHRGNLFDLLYVDRQAQPQQSKTLAWPLRLRLALGEARGMHFLHTAFPAPLIHRDLKSLNLLLSKNWTLKVSDFGLSRFRRRGVTDGPCGTTQWMAPEVIQGMEYDERADVYSFGINLWELCTRRVPWEGRNDVKSSVVRGERPPIDERTLDANCPKELIKLMERCWAAEPSARPDFGSIVAELKIIATKL